MIGLPQQLNIIKLYLNKSGVLIGRNIQVSVLFTTTVLVEKIFAEQTCKCKTHKWRHEFCNILILSLSKQLSKSDSEIIVKKIDTL